MSEHMQSLNASVVRISGRCEVCGQAGGILMHALSLKWSNTL